MDATSEHLRLKRIYEERSPDDGFRVLVDRLWPRGVSRERAAIDEWAEQIAPSAQLRSDWHHDPDRFDEFAARYRAELDANPDLVAFRGMLAEHAVVTLLYAARDPEINHAVVLRDYLAEVG